MMIILWIPFNPKSQSLQTPATPKNSVQKMEDMSVFEHQDVDQCDGRKSYQQCSSIARLSVSLKYYSSLDIINNDEHRDIFTDFVSNIYPNLLDDYIHFTKCHGDQIEEIHLDFLNNRGFKVCNINNCTYSSRHHNVDIIKNSIKTKTANPTFNFYAQTMDSLHFFVFHIFDAGLRILSSSKIDQEKLIKKQINDEYFDAKFARLKHLISGKDKNTKSFRKLGRGNNAKFAIKMTNDYDDITNENISNGTTCLDELYQHLQGIGVKDEIISKLQRFIDVEQFDTDALSMDISNEGKNGNLSTATNDADCTKAIFDFITPLKSMLSIYIYLSEC